MRGSTLVLTAIRVMSVMALLALSAGPAAGQSAAPSAAPVATLAPSESVGPPDAQVLCDLLLPEDFVAVGVEGAGRGVPNATEPGTSYCAYTEQFPVEGGIELDVFLLGTPEDAAAVFGMLGIVDPDAAAHAAELGVDAAVLDPGTPGDLVRFASIGVLNDRLAFSLALPSTDTSTQQLLSLARLVLERVAAIEAGAAASIAPS